MIGFHSSAWTRSITVFSSQEQLAPRQHHHKEGHCVAALPPSTLLSHWESQPARISSGGWGWSFPSKRPASPQKERERDAWWKKGEHIHDIFFGAVVQVISNSLTLYLASSVTPKTPSTVNLWGGDSVWKCHTHFHPKIFVLDETLPAVKKI